MSLVYSVCKPALSPLAQDMRVIYYDHRGMGRSDRRDSSAWILDTWADDIVRLSDALDIARPYVLGASFGGIVAMRYLARHPHHPAKVVC